MMLSDFLPRPARPLRIDDLPRLRQNSQLREVVVLADGYAIAAYAAPVQPGSARRFVSYAKVCRGEPASYWDAPAFAKFASEQEHACAGAALADALDAALMSLANLGFIDARSRAPRLATPASRAPALAGVPAFASA